MAWSIAFPFAAGVAVHLLYFQRYEYWRQLYSIMAAFVAVTLLSPPVLVRYANLSLTTSIYGTIVTQTAFAIGALGSTAIYRLYFNPLNRFPGPFSARLTDFWLAWHVGSDLKQYRKLQLLHEEYGDVVRTGANHISVVEPHVINDVLGIDSIALKGAWYDIDWPSPSMHGTRDREAHARLRQMWAPAFSDKALRAYDGRIKRYTKAFLGRLAEFEGQPIDATKQFQLYSFAVMAGLSFGKDERIMENDQLPELVKIMSEGMKILGVTPPIWFIRILLLVPGDPSSMKKFHAFTDSHLKDAVETNFHSNEIEKSLQPGSIITSWLFRMYQHLPNPAANPNFQADARLLMVGGSETTAITLTFIFFLLAQHPEHVHKLRAELRSSIKLEEWTDNDIKGCKHLDGVINEALRLHPAGPSGVYRLTPPAGMQVGDYYIPGNATIGMPVYIIHRHEAAYARPDEFIPERWYSQTELIRNPKAFATFSGGRFGCIGKNLAYLELRAVTASIVLRYDVRFAPGEDGTRLLNESLDHFTMGLAPLHLEFVPAKGED